MLNAATLLSSTFVALGGLDGGGATCSDSSAVGGSWLLLVSVVTWG